MVDICENIAAVPKYLQENGINTLVHYPIPLNRQPVLEKKEKYEIAEEISDTELSLPCSATHTKEEIMGIVKRINDFK